MQPNLRPRAVGASVIGFAVAAFASHAMVSEPPKADSTRQVIVDFLVAHHRGVTISAFADALAVCLLVLGAVGLVKLSGALDSVAGTVAIAGVTLSLGLTLVLDATIAAAATVAHRGGGDPVTLFRFADATNHFFAVPGVLFMVGLGLVLLRSGVVPAVFGGSGVALGVARVAAGLGGLLSGSRADEALFIVSALWMVALGVTLIARQERRPVLAAEAAGS